MKRTMDAQNDADTNANNDRHEQRVAFVCNVTDFSTDVDDDADEDDVDLKKLLSNDYPLKPDDRSASRGPPPCPPPSVSPRPFSSSESPTFWGDDRYYSYEVPIMGTTSTRIRAEPPNLGTEDPKTEAESEAVSRGCWGFFCHPESFCHRAIALFFMCILSFGSYFCYDNPGALQVLKLFKKQNFYSENISV